MDVAALARRLRDDARRTNQRRLLVLAGDRDAGVDAAFDALAGASADDADVAVVSTREGFRFERYDPVRADRLLGATRDAVVFDAHEGFSPNALGQLAGVVDGGGLLVLLTPPLREWPARRDSFDESLAVPPYRADDVTGRFRARLVETLRDHPGVAVVDVDAGRIERDGVVGEGAVGTGDASARSPVAAPPNGAFPAATYEACLTADQGRAVRALERLRDPGAAVVVEADRGRGKSSAAGLAAGALAAAGQDVLVTAPAFRSAREVFVRARALLDALAPGAAGEREGDGADGGDVEPRAGGDDGDGGGGGGGRAPDADADVDPSRHLRTAAGGAVRFRPPAEATVLPGDPDAVIVDEAAALPVRSLSSFLDAPSVAFCTTVHGYEGAGRGFTVRFRERLAESGLTVEDVRLEEPIRYARGDPVESWAFRALLLDARPPVDPLVADATPGAVKYRALPPEALLGDEHLLREAFGLLVLAHYRTEPNDLARLLDAPNLRLRALLFEGHVVSVALLAREGGLDAEVRREMYDGGRVAGNMLPDVLTSQLRDEDAGRPVGYRVMRIATHHAARSRGLGSHLLDAVAGELEDDVDWLGVGYGATPRLLRFWRRNGYRTVHLSTSRNAASGEYSALMLRPTSAAGRALEARHARWFRDRIDGVLADALRDLDPDVARAALAATDAAPDLSLSAREWRVVADAAYGPGLYDAAPAAFGRLALAHLLDREVDLDAREERLLVRKALQAAPWPAVADELGYVSTRQCMRSLGAAFRPLVDRYGDETALEERARYADGNGTGSDGGADAPGDGAAGGE